MIKMISANFQKSFINVEYHYIFHDLVSHKDAGEIQYAISKTNYFMSNGSFQKQHEMLQEQVDRKSFKDQASIINHIASLNKTQLKTAENKRKKLQSILSSAPNSDHISNVIKFHDEVIGLILEWFNIHDEILTENASDKEITDDALWAIADDLRARKDDGEFETYRKAYMWGEENIKKNGAVISVKKLERAYHKAKSEGKVGEIKKKVASIPIMITQRMRMDLALLGYTKDEMKYLTPKQANDIIKNKITSSNSIDRGRNQ